MAENKAARKSAAEEDGPKKSGQSPKAEDTSVPTFRIHGRSFVGKVLSDRMHRTVIVAWERRHYVPKYQRYERRFSKVNAHNPDEIDAKTGDRVEIRETRPISKTKHFIVVKKL